VFRKGRFEAVDAVEEVERYESKEFGSKTTLVPGSIEFGSVGVAPPSGPIVTKFGIMKPL
jgi:hypothetical protein